MPEDAQSHPNRERSPGDADPPRYDSQVVAREAMSKDPGLSAGLALRLAREAEQVLATMEKPDAPELSRQLMADSPEAGASIANVVARAAVEHCTRAGVRFPR